MSAKIYATNKDGEGRVMKIGEVEDISEYEIPVGMFANDIIITFDSIWTSPKPKKQSTPQPSRTKK